MKTDAIDPAEQRRLFLYLTKRYMAAESRLTQLDPPSESLDIGEAPVVELTPDAIAAMESLKAADADREAWRGGTIRDELYRRWSAIEAGRLVAVPDSPVVLEFDEQLQRTGMRTKFLWRARDGVRVRGVILSITDQLRPALQPPPEDNELWDTVLQIAMPGLSAAVQDVEAFFAKTDDLEVILHVNEVDPIWERGRRFPTL
ncbi:MAG TPA: hypothetical protein DCK98_01425 [Chloroflexi bacterium]|jgi:hypothetical protein|nr:hypothetical protein [Chloroflexota bacterium]HAL25812.1 hypothetical protein [Chloroflexota bacterium]